MKDKLSIRAYSPTLNSHSHDYNQLVMPLHGVIEMSIDEQHYTLGIGNCGIIPQGITHSFRAMEDARFLIADLSVFPTNLLQLESPFVSTSNSLQAFCRFVETQLEDHLNTELEDSMLVLFKQLLEHQTFYPKIDPRIASALEAIEMDLSVTHSLKELSTKANLSISQLKTLFKQQTGKTCGQYLLTLRMEKARALLVNTDIPAHLVAEKVGYKDQSAFSRRFSAYYGQSPKAFKSETFKR